MAKGIASNCDLKVANTNENVEERSEESEEEKTKSTEYVQHAWVEFIKNTLRSSVSLPFKLRLPWVYQLLIWSIERKLHAVHYTREKSESKK